MAPEETLPDSGPLAAFFVPNFAGIALVLALESISLEQRVSSLLPDQAHPLAILGLGVFAIANVNSLLTARVVQARIEHDVKLPNSYANPAIHKDAITFNCIQRGHQNFLEAYAQVVLSVLSTAVFANRPNIAGLILLSISAGRIMYAYGYSKNIKGRVGPVALSVFTTSIGIGYGFLVGATAFGLNLFTE